MAIAPPYSLTRGSSSAMPKWSRKATTCTAKASLSSNSPMSSIVRPALARAFSVAGTGPMPMTSGSTPTKANDANRMRTGIPKATAASSEASRHAVAPSLRPALLPAVTLPRTRKGVLSASRSAMVVLGLGGSSTVARP